MKRRNFLSGLLASPLALKARLLAFFDRKPFEHCSAPILPLWLARTRRQRQVVELLAEGKSMKEVAGVTVARRTVCNPLLHCSLPLGHEGPHIWLNPR